MAGSVEHFGGYQESIEFQDEPQAKKFNTALTAR